ncbi:LytTR family DNA-binding domain-containing protein [Stenotrophomonas tumulicola]|uniref:LytTR family transcriptional regulator n=1 Tax=Stenotrophomonas tumulicola TaxID=1685415 RepID=A0A7W3FQ67_9GAMM|nr:LytTR family DNA-binding domain-containing protein [Stenotrophomonas tumulicola]MBA8683620.1 LytTR family transcriptional regulator [Stenotrophomonas tumulicola]
MTLARARWRPTTRLLVWTSILLVTAVANAFVEIMDAQRRGDGLELWEPLIWELSSVCLILLTLPVLWWGCQRWPLHADTWKRRLPLYLLASVGWSLVHVTGMLALRHAAYAALGYHYVDDTHWASRLLYEYLKDVRAFFIFVAIEHFFSWFGRRRQGEAHLLAVPDDSPPEEAVQRPAHFLVRKLGKEFLVATADIEYAQAASNYVNLRVRGHDYPLRITMAALEQRLDPDVFLRSHRSWLVNRTCLRSIEPLEGGEALLHMADGGRVPCSRRQLPVLRQALGG